MCIGLPMRVLEGEGLRALCDYRGETRHVDLSLVGPQPPGTWLLTFLDSAREVIDETEARRALDAIEAVEQVMRGETAAVDHLFSDLIDREPPLPPHLSGKPTTDREEQP